MQSAETVVFQRSEKPCDAGHIPAPSDNEVPSSVIIMEVLQESTEKHKGSVFEPDFEKETLALTLINLLQIPIGPSL